MLTNDKRAAAYHAQNGTATLTPAQRRRVKQKTAHHELIGKYGRLRKRHEAKIRAEHKAQATQMAGFIRSGGYAALKRKYRSDKEPTE